jgi:hypothetical protein
MVAFGKEWMEGLTGIGKGLSDPAKRVVYEQMLRDDPYFALAEHYGTIFNQIGDRRQVDEHFTAALFENIAAADLENMSGGKKTAAYVPVKVARLQQRFEHAYTLPGDAMRLGLFKNLAQVAEQSNLEGEQLERAYKYAAYIANISVGKGSIEKVFGRDNLFVKFFG